MMLSMLISLRSMAKPLCMLFCFSLVLAECIFVSVICSAQTASRNPCCLPTVTAKCVECAMDIMEEIYLQEQIDRGGAPRQRGVQVTLEADWFRMTALRTKKPSALMVKRYWSLLKEPLTEHSALQSLYMIKRAMLDWPSMGAAIAKRASLEYCEARDAKQHMRTLEKQKASKARRMAAKCVPKVGNGAGKAAAQNAAKKSAPKVVRGKKQITVK
jgi:hypothetical protein